MAAISTLPQARRRKQVTYGKASRKAGAWNITTFGDDEDELASATNVVSHPRVVVKRMQSPAKDTANDRTAATVKDTYRIEKRDAKVHRSPKQVKVRSKEQDMWDVPSSDEEVGNSITRRSPPKVVGRRKVDSVVEEQEATLAPWEQKKASRAEIIDAKPAETATGVGETQLRGQLEDQAHQSEDVPVSSKAATPRKLVSPGTGSALERLKARKQQLERSGTATARASLTSSSTTQKRLDHGSSDSNPTPRKRHRSEKEANKDSDDVEMQDAPDCSSPSNGSGGSMEEDGDIFTISSSAHEERSSLKPRPVPRRQIPQNPRRGKLPKTTRSIAQTMVSAPARLTEMLFDDTDTTEDTACSPTTSLSGPSTPQKPSSSSRTSSPETAKKITSTPKQDHLWSELLPEESSASPSVLPLDGLTLQSNRRTAVKRTAASRILTKSSSDVDPPRQRTKLVDRLKASAPSTDSDESESEQDETDTDVDMRSDEPAVNSQSQSYSQSTVVPDIGTRPTYSRVRSYLPEDSFEDGLMLNMPSAPEPAAPVPSRKSSKLNAASQQSVYDMPESDDEDAGKRFRTVHELRAAGINQRFMDESSILLEDITAHDSSARGRRRSALMELTMKLMSSKAFVEKFFRQGFEQKLLAELEAPADDIADFVLAVALTSLMKEECPDHAAQTLKQRNASSWLARRLKNDTDASKLAKDRRNNMSKAAQS